VLFSFCFASRSLEEYVVAVEDTLVKGETEGRAVVHMFVSRDVDNLSLDQVRSAAYELASEKSGGQYYGPVLLVRRL
jgi:cobalamin biosynthesis protein CobD/CbiB